MRNPRRSTRLLMKAVLLPYQMRFVDEMLLDMDPEASAGRAGLPPDEGRRLLVLPKIRAALQVATSRRAAQTEIYGNEIVRRWYQIVTADVRDLQQIRRVACRYCWGLDHRRQFRDHELAEAVAAHRATQMKRDVADRVEFDDQGGGGYNGTRDPCTGPVTVARLAESGIFLPITSDHDCPACDGEGIVSIYLVPSRDYSPGAALLFEGVKVGADGSLEIKTRDRRHAENMLAQHLGLMVQRSINLNLDPTKLSDDQLADAIKQFSLLAEATGPGASGPLLEHSPAGEGKTRGK